MSSDCENESDAESNEYLNESYPYSDEYKNESESDEYKNKSDPNSDESGSDLVQPQLVERLTTKIFSTLKQLKAPSAIAYGAVDCSLPNPVLHIPPYGTLGLPLSTDDAQKIISQARQSPFGKGEKTVVDTTVRKSWELNSDQFSLKNPGWKKAIEKIVETVTTGLGLEKAAGKVSAELYKLLLYEPGAFFKPHKDSEKAPGMFATLVVCLPSPHEGGKLVMTHENEKYEFETASSSSYSCSYAAWYADITHEVQPVVSGYRLMLTYNLIRQTDLEVPSFSSGSGQEQVLSTLLEEYISGLEKGDKKLPPMLLHKLERKYTKANLKLKMLKPPDLAQVQMLAQLAKKLGFDVYLATLVLEISRDDECTDYEEKESHTLENVVELNGKLVMDSLDYPEGSLIDPKGQDIKRKADKQEHQGPTGNEGAPATYWYRDTVVALVPPAKQLDFIFKFQSDGSINEPLFCKFMQEFSRDPAQKPKLELLCELALKQKPKRNYYLGRQEAEAIPAYFQQAAVTALELGRLDLFDEGCKSTNDKIVLNTASLLGRLASKNGVATMTDLLMKGVRVASPIAKKVEFLKTVAEGFETAEKKLSSAEKVCFKQWSDEAILTAVTELTTLTKDDCASLAQLSKTVNSSLFESKTRPVILKAATMTKMTFIDELMSVLEQTLTKDQRSFIEMIIRSIWNEFVFEPKNREPAPQKSWHCWEREIPAKKDDFTENDILHIVEISVKILSSECVETIIIPAMLSAILTASKECTNKLFISLARKVIKNEIVGFKLLTRSAVPPSHKRLVQAFLVKFIVANVGPEPKAPANWSLPASSCSCADCSMINKFLQDPCQETFGFRCSEARRKHLYKIFANSRRDEDITGPLYDIATVRGGSPFTWQITKHRRSYQTAVSEWKIKAEGATLALSKLNNKTLASKLEVYLQPYFSIIMNANVKELPDLKSLVTTPQLSETKENAGPSQNQPTNQTGHKRGNDMERPEGGLAKRPKPKASK